MAKHLEDSTIGRLLDGLVPDPERRELDEHLAGCDDCRRIVSTLARDGAKQSAHSAVHPVVHPAARTLPDAGLFSGRKVGNYLLGSKLGSGAMGTVYEGRHQYLDRAVAVKILHTHVQDQSDLAARFLREAQSVSKLHHANLVEIIDFGRTDDEYLYLVMERLAGETLADYLTKEKRLSLADLRRIGVEIARGLAVAHDAGIVHRDLKPANIFLTHDGGPVKILDFGVAKVREHEHDVAIKTRSGALFGSPAYMSPEQCRGDSSLVTHASDLYSFGVILFELASGELPFLSSSLMEILRAHLQEAPPKLSRVRPDLPEAFERIVMRSLAKAPEKRFSTAAELEAALANLSDEAPRNGPSNSFGYRWILLASALFALLAFGIYRATRIANTPVIAAPSSSPAPSTAPLASSSPSPSPSPSPSAAASPVPVPAKRPPKPSKPKKGDPEIIVDYPE